MASMVSARPKRPSTTSADMSGRESRLKSSCAADSRPSRGCLPPARNGQQGPFALDACWLSPSSRPNRVATKALLGDSADPPLLGSPMMDLDSDQRRGDSIGTLSKVASEA